MKGLTIGARHLAVFMLTFVSIVGGSIPGYAQDTTGLQRALQVLYGGYNILWAGTIKTNCPGGPFGEGLDKRVFFNRGSVWDIPLYLSRKDRIDEPLFNAPPDVDIKAVTIKETSRDLLVELVDGSFYYGLYDSAGCTWHFIRVTQILQSGSASPEKVVGDALYALSTADVQVSRDTGRTWQEDTVGLGSDVLSDIALDSLQFVYGVSPTHLYKQHPDSSSWKNVGSFPAQPGFAMASVFVDRRNRIFVGTGSNGVYRSTDNGNSWSSDTAGMGNQQVLNFGDDALGNIYAPLGSILFRSSGGLLPWLRIDGGLVALTGSGIEINSVSGDTWLVAATNFGSYTSTDGGTTWSDDSSRHPADNVTGIVRASTGKIFAGAPRGIYWRNATDTIWTRSYPQGTYRSGLTLTTDAAGNIYTIDRSFPGPQSGYGYPVKSTDEGVSWNLDTMGVSKLLTRGISSTIFYVDELGGQHTSLWPGTSSWLPYKKSLGGSWTTDSTGMNISLSSYDGQFDLAGDGNGNLYCSNSRTGMFTRSVTGNVWISDTAGLGTTFITRLSRGLNGDMYGSAYGGVYFVRRSGVWTRVNPPPGVSIGYTGAISVDGHGAFFVAVSGGFPQIGKGVYFTKDDGKTWTKAGLDSLTITKMVSYGDSTYVLTSYRGVYILTTIPTAGVENVGQTPLKFALLQNYPNPFNPNTTIKYELPLASHVTLTVYDVLGRKVSALVNERREAGVHEVKFDASGLASGVYFYRLQAGNFVQTRKLLLLK